MKFSKITKSAISVLKSGQMIIEHGVAVTRTANGDLRWKVAAMVDGKRINRTIGQASAGVTREQAVKALEVLRTHAREDRLDLPNGRKNHRSFSEAATDYLARMEAGFGKNMKSKRQHINKLLIPYFGKYRADGITADLIDSYVRSRLATGLKQATVNRELATLSHMMRRIGIKSERRPDIVKGYEPRMEAVVLSDEEASRLMMAAAGDQDERLWLFVAFGLNTAMRHGEIIRVRYAHVDFQNRRIYVPKAKAGQREQPITEALCRLLHRQKAMDGDSGDYVFPSRVEWAKNPHRVSMAASFQRAVIRAGLQPDRITPHVMRRTAITRLVKAGVDLPTIQRISGHKTYAMVLRYVHIHGPHIDKAITAIDMNFTEAITPDLLPNPKPIRMRRMPKTQNPV